VSSTCPLWCTVASPQPQAGRAAVWVMAKL
jgi:hypothetical protein